MGYSHAVLNPTFSEKCKLYILKPRFLVSHTGRVAPDLCRAPTSVAGCPPGQKRNSDVRGSTHTLLVPLGVPEDDPLHVLRSWRTPSLSKLAGAPFYMGVLCVRAVILG